MTNNSLRTRVRACRSFFLIPGSRPDTFISRGIDGDAVIVDLESTVAELPILETSVNVPAGAVCGSGEERVC